MIKFDNWKTIKRDLSLIAKRETWSNVKFHTWEYVMLFIFFIFQIALLIYLYMDVK